MNLGQIMTAMSPPTVPDDTSQCVVCNQPREYQCVCRELLCSDHSSFECEFCGERFCAQHVTRVEKNFYICDADMPAFIKEAETRLRAERTELAEDLRRCQAKLRGEFPLEYQVGFVEQMVDRWIGRLEV